MLEAAKAGLEKLHDRIKQLETENAKLKEPKGCDGCKQNHCPIYLEAVNYSVVESKKDFYCSHYESKAP